MALAEQQTQYIRLPENRNNYFHFFSGGADAP